MNVWLLVNLTGPLQHLNENPHQTACHHWQSLTPQRLAVTLRRLHAQISHARAQLLTFCDYPPVTMTPAKTRSNAIFAPCVIQRRITNGYRAMRAAAAEAEVGAVDTVGIKGANPFSAIVGVVA